MLRPWCWVGDLVESSEEIQLFRSLDLEDEASSLEIVVVHGHLSGELRWLIPVEVVERLLENAVALIEDAAQFLELFLELAGLEGLLHLALDWSDGVLRVILPEEDVDHPA